MTAAQNALIISHFDSGSSFTWVQWHPHFWHHVDWPSLFDKNFMDFGKLSDINQWICAHTRILLWFFTPTLKFSKIPLLLTRSSLKVIYRNCRIWVVGENFVNSSNNLYMFHNAHDFSLLLTMYCGVYISSRIHIFPLLPPGTPKPIFQCALN